MAIPKSKKGRPKPAWLRRPTFRVSLPFPLTPINKDKPNPHVLLRPTHLNPIQERRELNRIKFLPVYRPDKQVYRPSPFLPVCFLRFEGFETFYYPLVLRCQSLVLSFEIVAFCPSPEGNEAADFFLSASFLKLSKAAFISARRSGERSADSSSWWIIFLHR